MLYGSQRLRQIILILGDLFTFSVALLATLYIRYGEIQGPLALHLWPFGIIMALWVVGFYIAGLYDAGLFTDALKLFRVYLEGMLGNLAIAFAFFYLVPSFGIAPRTNLFLYFALSICLGYAWRLAYFTWIDNQVRARRVLFIGTSEGAVELHELLETHALGMRLTAALATDHQEPSIVPIEWIKDASALPSFLDQEANTVIVLGLKLDAHPEIKEVLYHSLFQAVTLLDRAEIEEIATGRIPLTYVNESWFLHHLHEPEKEWFETAKRGFDILLAIPVSLCTLILTPFVALLITLSSKGPIFFSQIRIGKEGKTIRIWKFRTMHQDAETNGPQFTASAKTDPRLFAVGRWLRRLRIDELPQVWNVLLGDLSFVGPRPERPEFVEPLIKKMPHYQLRHLTRPGLTGWAQVKFLTPVARLDDNLTKLQYDLYYIKNRSLFLDVAILLKTIGIVLRRQGT